MKLDGKVAIVTGGGRGIGREISLGLARSGADVVIAARTEAEISATAAEIRALGRKAVPVKADVAKRADVQNIVKTTIDNFGGVHILVNNAGITHYALLMDIEEKDWDEVMNIDLKSVLYCIQAVAPYMIKQHYGKILNMSSIAAFAGFEGMATYAVAKAGVAQLTKAAAHEFGPHGINVNALAPGTIMTDIIPIITRQVKKTMDEFVALRKQFTVLGRVGETHDVANAALFLVSDESSFITGQVLSVDGGRVDCFGP